VYVRDYAYVFGTGFKFFGNTFPMVSSANVWHYGAWFSACAVNCMVDKMYNSVEYLIDSSVMSWLKFFKLKMLHVFFCNSSLYLCVLYCCKSMLWYCN